MTSVKDKLEIFGIVALIVSLLILAYEIRQNTNTSAANAIFALNQSARNTQFMEATDPLLVQLILKAEKNLDSLNEEERYRYQRWVFAYLNSFEPAWNHGHRGVISDADLEGWKTAYCGYMSRPSFRQVADSIPALRSQFHEEFNQACK